MSMWSNCYSLCAVCTASSSCDVVAQTRCCSWLSSTTWPASPGGREGPGIQEGAHDRHQLHDIGQLCQVQKIAAMSTWSFLLQSYSNVHCFLFSWFKCSNKMMLMIYLINYLTSFIRWGEGPDWLELEGAHDRHRLHDEPGEETGVISSYWDLSQKKIIAVSH